jgi:cyclin T
MAAVSDPRSFDASDLPSVKDGMSLVEEGLKRRKTCRFIEEAGRILKLPRVATATAMVFFHRFYAKHSFNEHDRFEVAVACILLAAKTEEAPRKVMAVIDECYKLRSRAQAAGRMSQTSPNHPASISGGTSLDPASEEFLKLKERILLLERVVLHTIGFELSIDHPYKFLVETIKKLINKRAVEYVAPNKLRDKMMHELVQYSMNFANDSMHTSLCLQFDASQIATACVYLGGQFSKVAPTGGQTWLEVLEWNHVESLACKSYEYC